MSRDCAITLLHENVTHYCVVGARIECAKIVVFVLIRAKVIIIRGYYMGQTILHFILHTFEPYCTSAIRLKSVQYEVQYGLTHVIILLLLRHSLNVFFIVIKCFLYYY